MESNILDYIHWRGDLPFGKIPFNEVDALILARAAYLPFDLLSEAVQKEGNLQTAAKSILEIPDIQKLLLWKEDLDLLEDVVVNPRFDNITYTGFVNEKNPEDQMQFCAVTFQVPDTGLVLSYRGTDSTLIGWKEDFNMSFQDSVPGQHRAVEYLQNQLKESDLPAYCIGHSKGGNFAVFASAFCPEKMQDQITAVYNFDGPGFSEKTISQQGYQKILPKVKTFVPQSSIVGLLMEHEEDYIVVKSDQHVNFMQHDIYSWECERDQFHILDSITRNSRFIDHSLKDWVASMSAEQREQVIDSLYEVLSQTNAKTVRQIMHNPFRYAPKIVSSLKGLDENDRKMILNSLKKLISSMRHSL